MIDVRFGLWKLYLNIKNNQKLKGDVTASLPKRIWETFYIVEISLNSKSVLKFEQNLKVVLSITDLTIWKHYSNHQT